MPDKLPDAVRESPLFLTTRAALALTARVRRALKVKGIDDVNPAQLAILSVVETHEGITPTALAREVMYEKSTLTPLLEGLERAELLLRARDPRDGRVQRLYPTKKGRRRRREAEAVLASATAEIMATLSKKVLRHHAAFCEAVLASEEPAPAERA